jgi:hypothetical protein
MLMLVGMVGVRRAGAIALLKAAVAVPKVAGLTRPATKERPAVNAWLVFRGESHCKGINETVSFSFSPQRHEVRDVVFEQACRKPSEGTTGTVRWTLDDHFSPDARGQFAVAVGDAAVSTHTAIMIRGKFRATGQIIGTHANGTLSDHVSIECDRGRMMKNCRRWTASVVSTE